MTKIGILSDTHSYLEEQIFEYFKDVDMVWHAGDIGSSTVTNALQKFKPLYAVYGNIDDYSIRAEFPENLSLEIEGCKILITHIAGPLGKYTPRVQQLLQSYTPNILVCGHSHIVKVAKDPKYGLLHINPGAAGIHGFHKMRTAIRMEIENGKPQKMELIELGLRGKIQL